MPLTISLRTENGSVLDETYDDRNILTRLPKRSTGVLRFIDPYANTIMNSFQSSVLAEELGNIGDVPAADQDTLAKVHALAARATKENLYLWIIGD